MCVCVCVCARVHVYMYVCMHTCMRHANMSAHIHIQGLFVLCAKRAIWAPKALGVEVEDGQKCWVRVF